MYNKGEIYMYEKTMKQYIKQDKAITLVALMITIIILLILAGVALNLALRRKRNIQSGKRSE